MKILTRGELVALLSGIKGATFATITTKTDPRLLKTNNPFKDVSKVSRINVTLGFRYEAAVNRQRIREDGVADFEAKPRQWGQHIPGTILVENKGTVYLETKVEKSIDYRYINAQGTAIPDEMIAPFLPKKGESRQELEKEVIVRDYKIDSIVGINLKGEEYIVA